MQELHPPGRNRGDLYGPGYLNLAVALGVAPDRIQTTVAMEQAAEIGARTDGPHNATTREPMVELVELALRVPCNLPSPAHTDSTAPPTPSRSWSSGTPQGKIVLIP